MLLQVEGEEQRSWKKEKSWLLNNWSVWKKETFKSSGSFHSDCFWSFEFAFPKTGSDFGQCAFPRFFVFFFVSNNANGQLVTSYLVLEIQPEVTFLFFFVSAAMHLQLHCCWNLSVKRKCWPSKRPVLLSWLRLSEKAKTGAKHLRLCTSRSAQKATATIYLKTLRLLFNYIVTSGFNSSFNGILQFLLS